MHKTIKMEKYSEIYGGNLLEMIFGMVGRRNLSVSFENLLISGLRTLQYLKEMILLINSILYLIYNILNIAQNPR